jgi:acyl transferase domain-containing protein
LAQRYKAYLTSYPQTSLKDACFTANVGRSHFDYRLAIVVESTKELRDQLHAFTAGKKTTGVVHGCVTPKNSSKIAFLFTGQGSQSVGMGQQLYETQPTFRQALDRCAEILRPYLGKSLLDILYPKPATLSEVEGLLDETVYTQPALFALEYALAELWMSWKIIPTAVLGHSLGEYVAACVAGAFSLEDGLKLIAERARLMQALPQKGKMVAVFAEESQVAAAIQPYARDVAIAAVNGPKTIVISGRGEVVDVVTASLHAAGVKTKPLKVSHAFHSPLMDPILGDFHRIATEVTYSVPRIDVMSNITGQSGAKKLTTAAYWTRHLRQPVCFAAGMATLRQHGYEVFIEIGPTPTLLGMGRQCLEQSSSTKHQSPILWLPSLRQGRSDWQQLLQSLGELYVCGVPVDWAGFDREYPRRRIALPTYPFQRQRYWVKTDGNRMPLLRGGSQKGKIHPLLGQRMLSALKEVQFESQISHNMPDFLKHHRIFESIIVPAAVYVEMALAAGAVVFKADNVVLEQVVFQQALILPENEGKIVQVILFPEGTRAASFQIFSLTTDEEREESSWTPHVSGKVGVKDKDSEPPPMELTTLQAQCCEEIAVEDAYRGYRERNIDLGPSFRAIAHLWRREGEALGQIHLPETLLLEAGNYKLHPVLLDACFQVLGATFFDRDKKETYLPVELESFHLYRRPGTCLWSYVRINPVKDSDDHFLTANLDLLDETGNVVAQIKGLSVRRAT